MTTYRTVEMLPKLGFRPASGNILEDWTYKFGALELGVVEGSNQWFQPSLIFNGGHNNFRTISFIEFTLPAELESEAQALAMLGYYLRDLPMHERPEWVDRGLELQHALPWRAKPS